MVERQAQPMNVEPEDDTQQMLALETLNLNSTTSDPQIPNYDPGLFAPVPHGPGLP